MIRAFGRAYHRWELARHRGIARRLREMEACQWWGPDALRRETIWRVERAVRSAGETVPFYRARLDELGIAPAEFSFERDFHRLPLLTKEMIQERGAELLADGSDPAGLRRNQTGGSTGQMVRFYQDEEYEDANLADKHLSYAMCGYRPGDRWAFLWGSDRDAPHGAWITFKERFCFNRLWINAFDLDRGRLGQWAEDLRRFRPTLLVGYVSALALMATWLRERGIDDVRPGGVQATAEELNPSQRALITRAFHAPVYNRYGCREVGNVAQECSAHDGLHVFCLTNYVEILAGGAPGEPGRDGMGREPAPARPAAPGETGRIVVTNLTNRAFPLLRYDTADLGVAMADAPCPCGRGWPRIAGVAGRISDIVVTPEGRLIHGEFFTHLFYAIPGVRQFQVEQTELDHLIVRIVRGEDFRPASVDALKRAIAESASPALRVDLEFPEKIAVTSSGKFRYAISRLDAGKALFGTKA